MMTKEGIITGIVDTTAWIKTTRSKSCDSCGSKDSCGEHSKTEEMTIQVENSLNASTGDRVVVGFRTAPLLKITFLLYIFPIILMMIGAGIGELVAVRLNTDISITSMVLGVLFFIISFFIIRLVNNAWAVKKEYQPFMMRLMHSSEFSSNKSCSVK